jgi:hypothetical protein
MGDNSVATINRHSFCLIEKWKYSHILCVHNLTISSAGCICQYDIREILFSCFLFSVSIYFRYDAVRNKKEMDCYRRHFIGVINKETLENTERTMKNGQSREHRRDNHKWTIQRNWQHLTMFPWSIFVIINLELVIYVRYTWFILPYFD